MGLFPNKTTGVELLAHQAAAHGEATALVGSSYDCRLKIAARVFLYHGYIEATADTNPGSFLIQLRPEAGTSTVAEHWITHTKKTAAGVATVATEAMTATEPAGTTVLACASTTGFVAGDKMYIRDGTTLADSEWATIHSIVTDTSVNIVDGLTTGKDSSDVLWGNASTWVVDLDLTTTASLRVVWSHGGTTGADGHVKALAVFYDEANMQRDED